MLAFCLLKKERGEGMPLASSTQQEYLHAMCCQRQFSCVSPRLFSSWCCHWCETSDVSCVCSHNVRNRLLPGRAKCVCKTPRSLPAVVLRPARPGAGGALEGVATVTTLRDPHPHRRCVVSKEQKQKASPQAALQMTCAVSPWRMCLSAWRPSISVPHSDAVDIVALQMENGLPCQVVEIGVMMDWVEVVFQCCCLLACFFPPLCPLYACGCGCFEKGRCQGRG